MVERLDSLSQTSKVRRPGIGVPQGSPVLASPGFCDPDSIDRRVEAPLRLDWDSQPAQPLAGLDEIAIAPIAPGELRIIQKNELVDAAHNIEIALPGNVARLDDRHALAHKPAQRGAPKAVTATPITIRQQPNHCIVLTRSPRSSSAPAGTMTNDRAMKGYATDTLSCLRVRIQQTAASTAPHSPNTTHGSRNMASK